MQIWSLKKREICYLVMKENFKRAKEEGKAITESHKKRAEKVYDEIVEEARAEANLIIERAKVEIEREKEKS